jgi:hypothetical protein
MSKCPSPSRPNGPSTDTGQHRNYESRDITISPGKIGDIDQVARAYPVQFEHKMIT